MEHLEGFVAREVVVGRYKWIGDRLANENRLGGRAREIAAALFRGQQFNVHGLDIETS